MKAFPFRRWGLVLVLVIAFPSLLCAAGNLTQNSARECAICHFRWLDPFVKGKGTALAPLETEDVSGAELMCLSCHDGSTVDSRLIVWKLGRHKTGVRPSRNVEIPDVFPLSPKGEIVCTTCHSAHSISSDTDIERAIFLRVSNHDSAMCEMCHKSRTVRGKNHPLRRAKKPLPRELFEAGAIPGKQDRDQVICESCHIVHGGVEAELVLPAGDSRLCLVCHPQPPVNPSSSIASPQSHPLFLTFQASEAMRGRLFTGSGGTLQCLTCHRVHRSETEAGALAFPQEVLCAGCHPEQGWVEGSDHDLRMTAPAGTNMFGETAGQSGVCGACHAVHTGTGPSLWARRGLTGRSTSSSLCLTCHGKGGVAAGKGVGEFSHPVKAGKVECSSCHEPHRWTLAGKKGPGVKSEGDGQSSFLRKPWSGDPSLCTGCHPEQGWVEGSDHDLRMTAPAGTNMLGKTAGQSGVCGACHVVHNGAGPSLWARRGLTGRSTSSSLCLTCHGKGGVAGNKGVGEYSHPVGAAIKGTAGKVECSSCHEPHRWTLAGKKGPGVKSEGDGQSSFLRKPWGGDPSLCAGCHPEQGWVEGSDHDLRMTAPAGTNMFGETAGQSGVCGACHAVHNGAGPSLWARRGLTSRSTSSSLCLTCHGKGGVAAGKGVGEYSHPVGVAISGTMGPLPVKAGKVECSSCHEPHRWALAGKKGPGVKSEGDGQSSFLRKPWGGDPSFCTGCHPEQGWVEGSDHDLRMTAPASTNMLGETAGQSGVCGACHVVHNGTGPSLWARRGLSTGRSTPSDLCLTCHGKGGVAGGKGVGEYSHPVGVARKGAAGSLLLKAGKVECSSCHDPHRWSLFLTREKKQGGNREGDEDSSFLRRPNLAVPLLCMECHPDKGNFSGSSHDMRVVAPDYRNAAGHQVLQEGVCSACHEIHNAPQKIVLSASPLGYGDGNFMERVCEGCHRDGGVGKAKTVAVGSHPEKLSVGMTREAKLQVMTSSKTTGGKVLLFLPEGEESLKGDITCPTCHDPHPPKGASPAGGKGADGEPTIRETFLRRGLSDGLCANCHGVDALSLFRYYHMPAERERFRNQLRTRERPRD